jgi:hypothetical protein
MRRCNGCGIDLIDSTLISRKSAKDEVIEYLTCNGCGHDNILTGYLNPKPVNPDPSFLIFNERTELFDEFDMDGVLIRANVIYSPWEMPSSRDHVWPPERRKPKRAGNETWPIPRESKEQ